MVKSRRRWALAGFAVLLAISAIWPIMAVSNLVERIEGYPYAAEDADAVSPYGFTYRSPMDFVAWTLNQTSLTLRGKPFINDWDGSNDPDRWGYPPNWTMYATKQGFTVDHHPTVGAVAQWSTRAHVAMVTKVHEDGSIDVEEYTDLAFARRAGVTDAEAYIHLERGLPGGVWRRSTTPSGELTGTARITIDVDDNNNGGLDVVLLTVSVMGQEKRWSSWRTILRTPFGGLDHGTISYGYDLPEGVVCARLSFDVFSRNVSIDGKQSRQLAPHGFRVYRRQGQGCGL